MTNQKSLDKKKAICKHHFIEVREDFEEVDCDGTTRNKVQVIIYCEHCGKVSHDKTL